MSRPMPAGTARAQRSWLASALCSLALLSACATARTGPVAFDPALLASAQAHGAKQRAPDLLARAERARREAGEAAQGTDQRSQRTNEAQLWLEAASVEAARVQLSEQRLASEQTIAGVEQESVGLEQARAELAREIEGLQMAQRADDEVERALVRASLTPARRPKLPAAEVSRGAQALLARALLLQTALHASSADPRLLKALDKAIAEARISLAREPERALDRAKAALERALAAVAALLPPPTPSESSRASSDRSRPAS